MSKLESLIQELCPSGIEVKQLGDITLWDKRFTGLGNETVSFKHVSSAVLKSMPVSNGEVKLLATGQFDGYTTETIAGRNVNEGEVITVPSGGSANIKYFNGRFVDSGNIIGVAKDDTINLKYVYNFLLTKIDLVQSYFRGSSLAHPNMSEILKIEIPLPPIQIQHEIVGILDKFAALDTELQTELAMRQRQFEYYRDKLLSFENRDDVEFKPLAEIGEFIRGRRFTKDDYVDIGGVGCIHYGEIYTHYGTSAEQVISHVRSDLAPLLRYAQPGDVVLVDVGETVEDVGKAVAWLGKEQVAIHDHCYSFRHRMNPVFVSYCMQTQDFRAAKAKYVARTKVKTLLIRGFSKVKIPVPSLEEQERIVLMLSEFERLLNKNGDDGLPFEIKARRKQHEYYRAKLLTFDKVAAL